MSVGLRREGRRARTARRTKGVGLCHGLKLGLSRPLAIGENPRISASILGLPNPDRVGHAWAIGVKPPVLAMGMN